MLGDYHDEPGYWYPGELLWPLRIPFFLDKEPEPAKTFLSIHGTVWILLVISVVGHAGAAMHHHFIKKDKVLKQMTTGA
ncbi:MAG: cytochrome b/b6 domain-containing protein [Gammaproteobacteria bacterium]|nr:cytochrome b/b6 domain-containing protein [Gammaproteobacteria bacterium]MBQ0838886.1 cytochrome b/b6 domain-containing protein [Gammaproteobacteria bacterium]